MNVSVSPNSGKCKGRLRYNHWQIPKHPDVWMAQIAKENWKCENLAGFERCFVLSCTLRPPQDGVAKCDETLILVMYASGLGVSGVAISSA